MIDYLVNVCREGTIRNFNFFHFIQNVIGVRKIMDNLALEYYKFDFFGHKEGQQIYFLVFMDIKSTFYKSFLSCWGGRF